jgi:hypothetical protein
MDAPGDRVMIGGPERDPPLIAWICLGSLFVLLWALARLAWILAYG